MHQPVYKDSLTGKYLMPWVRLHSTKGYYDMVRILAGFPKIHQTFNLVPSLLSQIEDYTSGRADDDFLNISRKPADTLNDEDKDFLLSNFFMANWDTMIKPYPRYWELLTKRGFKEDNDLKAALSSFAVNDLRDLQVYFNLVWFGYMAREDYPVINKLLEKGRDFTEEDKALVLDTQLAVMKQIIPTYKKFQDAGQIEIIVSPFYHPILPLLVDTDIAKRAMPHAPMPDRLTAPEDARQQIEKSITYYEKHFGMKPRGMWPSEGSVCPELISIFSDAGIKWIATDEEILMNSMNVSDKGNALFIPYKAKHNGHFINMIFRDHWLSDLIGFVYSKNEPAGSANDMLHNISLIGDYVSQHTKDDNHLVSIILDGENPWEYYPDGGRKFLTALYEKLSSSENIRTVTVSEYLEGNPPTETINNLFSGSWINHNYDIWIGSTEENTAWNYLKKTRDFLLDNAGKNGSAAGKQKLAQAWECIYTAEGSDWFWWYGDDFSTDNDELFDKLFRLNLSNVYKILNLPAPEYLNIPIITEERVTIKVEPVGFIDPIIDGLNTHFYEWQEAGCYDARKPGGTMHKAENYLSAIYYGFNSKNMFFRLDPLRVEDLKNTKELLIHIHMIKPSENKLSFHCAFPDKSKQYYTHSVSSDGVNFNDIHNHKTICSDKIIELSIPFKELKFKSGEEVHFFVQVKRGEIELERQPKTGYISFKVPGEDYTTEMWGS